MTVDPGTVEPSTVEPTDPIRRAEPDLDPGLAPDPEHEIEPAPAESTD